MQQRMQQAQQEQDGTAAPAQGDGPARQVESTQENLAALESGNGAMGQLFSFGKASA